MSHTRHAILTQWRQHANEALLYSPDTAATRPSEALGALLLELLRARHPDAALDEPACTRLIAYAEGEEPAHG